MRKWKKRKIFFKKSNQIIRILKTGEKMRKENFKIKQEKGKKISQTTTKDKIFILKKPSGDLNRCNQNC